MLFRPYTSDDYQTCVAICASNTPSYFAPAERMEFETFLKQHRCPYYVVCTTEGQVVGCGGYDQIPNTPVALLVWGMIDASRHRQGLGSLLLWYRLAVLAADPAISVILLQTSQHSAAFFEQAGFTIQDFIEDGIGPGLHRYDMQLELDEAQRTQIMQHATHVV